MSLVQAIHLAFLSKNQKLISLDKVVMCFYIDSPQARFALSEFTKITLRPKTSQLDHFFVLQIRKTNQSPLAECEKF